MLTMNGSNVLNINAMRLISQFREFVRATIHFWLKFRLKLDRTEKIFVRGRPGQKQLSPPKRGNPKLSRWAESCAFPHLRPRHFRQMAIFRLTIKKWTLTYYRTIVRFCQEKYNQLIFIN